MIGTVRDPVRKAKASRWEFEDFNAMLHLNIRISLLFFPGSKLST